MCYSYWFKAKEYTSDFGLRGLNTATEGQVSTAREQQLCESQISWPGICQAVRGERTVDSSMIYHDLSQ